jgi:hypothetical protein
MVAVAGLALAFGTGSVGQLDISKLGPQVGELHGATEVAGKHLRVRAGLSDSTAAPGHRVTLMIDVTPGGDIHVYAPGQDGYIAVAVKLDPSPDFRIGEARYPASRDYFFAPLNERVKVYDRPFRILQDVTMALTPALRQRAASKDVPGGWIVSGTGVLQESPGRPDGGGPPRCGHRQQ